jgi:predicted TIM-barrel fold metal-dependent hydrolase
VSTQGANARLAKLHAWLAQTVEPALDPALPIVDPHHHLWDRDGYTYLLPQFLADVETGHNVVGSLYVECLSMYRAEGPRELAPVGETEFIVGQAALSASGSHGPRRLLQGIIGYADLSLGDRALPVLEAQAAAANGRLRGIRYTLGFDPTGSAPVHYPTCAGLAAHPQVRLGLQHLQHMGLAFDAWTYFNQLDDVADLAAAMPGLTIVVDHVGGPIGVGRYADQREETMRTWRAAMARLARFPNVHVKLGGLGMRLAGLALDKLPAPAGSEELAAAWKPYIGYCIETFGAARCMFESNYPVDKVAGNYAVLWNAFKRLASAASAGERQALFAGTACKVYGIEV